MKIKNKTNSTREVRDVTTGKKLLVAPGQTVDVSRPAIHEGFYNSFEKIKEESNVVVSKKKKKREAKIE